jgi:hypothetical protein
VLFLPCLDHNGQRLLASPRVAPKHRAIIKRASKKLKISEAEVVHRALEEFKA